MLSKKHLVNYKKIFSFDDLSLEELNNFDYYIIVSSIVCSKTEVEIIKNLNRNKKITIAIGPFATNKSNEYLSAGANVVVGEPEFFFYNEDISQIKFNAKSYQTVKKADLNDLPYPKWNEIMNMKSIKLYGNFKSVPILATRGCPYSCFRYCVYPLQQGRVIRQRSPENILKEMQYWHDNYKVELFIFRDPVFSINKNHTLQLCNLIISSNIKIKFIIETHLRILDDKLIKILKTAGLIYVKVGIENADTNILNNENRFTEKQDQQLEKIKMLKENKIEVSAMYILGFPSDNEETSMATINYAIKLNTEYAQFSTWTPYPGTPAFKEYENIITSTNYEDFDQYKLVYKHKNLSVKQLRNLLSTAYQKYYFRLEWLIKYGFKKIGSLYF